MTFKFTVDRENGTWTAYNPDGIEIDNGELPLTDQKCTVAILEDKGVSNPVRDALVAIYETDWTTESL